MKGPLTRGCAIVYHVRVCERHDGQREGGHAPQQAAV